MTQQLHRAAAVEPAPTKLPPIGSHPALHAAGNTTSVTTVGSPTTSGAPVCKNSAIREKGERIPSPTKQSLQSRVVRDGILGGDEGRPSRMIPVKSLEGSGRGGREKEKEKESHRRVTILPPSPVATPEKPVSPLVKCQSSSNPQANTKGLESASAAESPHAQSPKLGRALPDNPEETLKSLALRSFKAKKAKAEGVGEVSDKQEGSSTQSNVVQPKVGTGYNMYTDSWSKDKLLGRGSFGAVYKCTNKRTEEQLAVKQVVIKSEDMLSRMIDEVVLMCRASFRNKQVVECFGWSVSDDTDSTKEVHPFTISKAKNAVTAAAEEIPRLADVDRAAAIGKNFNIFMECVDQGSISSLLKKSGPLHETELRRFLKQLLIGLRSLHAAGIAHRDIKCENLLLSRENALKVADFGCAKRASQGSRRNPQGIEGSIPWMAPELLKQSTDQRATYKFKQGALDMWKKADVWAIGCTVIEMAAAKPPWNTYSNPASAMYAIATCKEPPQPPQSLNPQGKDFVRACLQLDPTKRPSVAMLCFHDYVKAIPL